jgi:hypothetical protein
MIKAKRLLFIDSGAHGLYNEHVHAKVHETSKYEWFTTEEFWAYVDKYAAFIKNHEEGLSIYANVDVIFNPKMTWEVQQYLEREWEIKPLPVVHHGTPLKWLEKYLDKGYEYIGLGGRAQDATQKDYLDWADESFNVICGQASRLPLIKVHGFAVTAHPLMVRYPWYSVDSTSWLAFGGYGMCIHPLWRNGKWDYSQNYEVVKLSVRASSSNKVSILNSRTHEVNKVFLKYIEEKGFTLGMSKWEKGEEIKIEDGLCNNDVLRCDLNAIYFMDLVKHLPQWPWPFLKSKQLKTF